MPIHRLPGEQTTMNESTLRYTVVRIIGTPAMATHLRVAMLEPVAALPLESAESLRDDLQRASIRRGNSMTVTRYALESVHA